MIFFQFTEIALFLTPLILHSYPIDGFVCEQESSDIDEIACLLY
jgi:hypothetical protein